MTSLISGLHFDAKHNIVAILEEHPGFEDVTRWLRYSRIHHAISYDLPIYEQHIVDFWESAEVGTVNKKPAIKATVRGKSIVITENTVRKVLKLGDSEDDLKEMSAIEVLNGFKMMRYEGDFSKKKEIKKALLSRDWRFICHMFIHCLQGRKGGYDGLNMEWAAAMYHVCADSKFNISWLIFSKLVDNANASNKWMMYPRFIQMFINDKFPKIKNNDVLLKLGEMTKRVYSECVRPGARCGFSGKWTSMFKEMYTTERWKLIQKQVKSDEQFEEKMRKLKEQEVKNTEGRRITRKRSAVAYEEVDQPSSKAPRKGKETTFLHVSPKRKTGIESLESLPKTRIPTNGEILSLMSKEFGEKVAKEIMCIKSDVNKTRKLKEKVKQQRVIMRDMWNKIEDQGERLDEQNMYIVFQYEVMQKLYGMINDLQEKAGVSCDVDPDELFSFEEFKKKSNMKERLEKAKEDVIEAEGEGEDDDVNDELVNNFVK